MQKFIVVLMVGLCLIMAACDTGQSTSRELPEDPQVLLSEVVENMQAIDTFRMTVEQVGKPYPLLLSFDGTSVVQAELRRGTAQFVSPNELFINVNLRIGVVVTVDIFSRDDIQWASFPSGGPWYQLPPFPDFDISRLMAEGDGMEYAMENLVDIKVIGEETLIDGTNAIHIQANATGDVVRGLLFGLIEPEDDVQVDVFINTADTRFALVEVTMLETVTEENNEQSVWRIEFYDYNAPQDFEAPLLAEATEEA